jgi:hypothetical protein
MRKALPWPTSSSFPSARADAPGACWSSLARRLKGWRHLCILRQATRRTQESHGAERRGITRDLVA